MRGIAFDSSGNLYVADTDNNRIQKFDSNGNFITKWGSFGCSLGVYISGSSNNKIYNNIINGTTPVLTDASVNFWNTTKILSINIINGSWLGGSYYATPSGNGFSQICIDANLDGICDSSYTLAANNIDYLPLRIVPPCTDADGDG